MHVCLSSTTPSPCTARSVPWGRESPVCPRFGHRLPASHLAATSVIRLAVGKCSVHVQVFYLTVSPVCQSGDAGDSGVLKRSWDPQHTCARRGSNHRRRLGDHLWFRHPLYTAASSVCGGLITGPPTPTPQTPGGTDARVPSIK